MVSREGRRPAARAPVGQGLGRAGRAAAGGGRGAEIAARAEGGKAGARQGAGCSRRPGPGGAQGVRAARPGAARLGLLESALGASADILPAVLLQILPGFPRAGVGGRGRGPARAQRPADKRLSAPWVPSFHAELR